MSRPLAGPEPRGFAVLWVRRGSLAVEVTGERVVIRRGMGLVVRPGTEVEAAGGLAGPGDWCWLRVEVPTGRALPGLSLAVTREVRRGLEGAGSRSFAVPEGVAAAWDGLLGEQRDRSPFSFAMARAYLHEMLIGIVRGLAADGVEDGRREPSDQVRRALQWIEANLTEIEEVGQVASAAGLCVSSLRRRFVEELGESPSACVTRLRVERAKRLLRETDRPVTEVAVSLGFGTSSHFGLVFRRISGQTPSNFRRAGRVVEGKESKFTAGPGP